MKGIRKKSSEREQNTSAKDVVFSRKGTSSRKQIELMKTNTSKKNPVRMAMSSRPKTQLVSEVYQQHKSRS
jgi:hypothetical protein